MRYNLAFTTGALLYSETMEYINHIENYNEFLTKEASPDYLVISTNSESSKKKFKSEIDKRLRNLNEDYLEMLKTGEEMEQKIVLFLAICKTYKIITEFCLEVIYKKWKKFDKDLTTYDFHYFLSTKLSDEQYNSISENTRNKLSQIAIKIIKDVGILTKEGINQLEPSKNLKHLIKESNDDWFFDCLLIQN